MRRHQMLFAAMALANSLAVPAAFAQQGAETADTREIVVTGRSLKDTADVLAACLARGCSPDEDVAATLAHAENLFVGGDYDKARSTLLRSVSRNRKHGKAFPVPVSDLFRANSRVAEHMGEGNSYRLSVLDMRDTLRGGLGPDDPRTLVAQVEVGDSRAKLGFPDEAERIYRDIEKQAIALGHPRVAMYARVRVAILKFAMAEDNNSIADRKAGRALLEQIIANPLPGASEFALTARIMLARIDRAEGRSDSTADIVREFAASGGATRPLLLFSEPIKMIETDTQADGFTTQRVTISDLGDRWADVGFWVNPDGKVGDVEVLRGKGDQRWLESVVAHLNSRIYAPLKTGGNDGVPGFYLIERYTLTANWMSDTTGTRMRRRDASPKIERLDITPEDYAPPAEVAAEER